jgi:hypothetical protein
MLEMCPPALCAHERRSPRRWHSRSWLCSVQCSVAAVRDRVTAPESASLRTCSFRHSRSEIATDLESYSCTSASATGVESNSCEKSRGAPPPDPTAPLLRAAKLSKIGFTARRFAAGLSSGFSGPPAHGAGCSSPLECALTPKQGWGVPPPLWFLP